MFFVFAGNNIDTSYRGEFIYALDAFLFGVWAYRNGNSMGVEIYYDEHFKEEREERILSAMTHQQASSTP